jgi:hypothetical protein
MPRHPVPAPSADSVLVFPDFLRRNAKYIALAFLCTGILAYAYGGPPEKSFDDAARNSRFRLLVFPLACLARMPAVCRVFLQLYPV